MGTTTKTVDLTRKKYIERYLIDMYYFVKQHGAIPIQDGTNTYYIETVANDRHNKNMMKELPVTIEGIRNLYVHKTRRSGDSKYDEKTDSVKILVRDVDGHVLWINKKIDSMVDIHKKIIGAIAHRQKMLDKIEAFNTQLKANGYEWEYFKENIYQPLFRELKKFQKELISGAFPAYEGDN